MSETQYAFPFAAPAEVAERLRADPRAFQRSPLTADEREVVAAHLDGMAARVRAGEVVMVDIDDDWDHEARTVSKAVRVVVPQ